MLDEELEAYRRKIGEEEYNIQYHRIYSHSHNIRVYNTRYSGSKDVKPDLNKIKEKYKNGVTEDILKEMFSDS